MHQLRRRIVVDVLIPNTGDHPRNHGFLYAGPDGWRLSPADDPNPVPGDVKPRALRAAVDCDDRSASPPWATSPAEYFDSDTGEARDIAADVGRVVTTRRGEAAQTGLTPTEIAPMAPAFGHEGLRGPWSSRRARRKRPWGRIGEGVSVGGRRDRRALDAKSTPRASGPGGPCPTGRPRLPSRGSLWP